MRDRLKDYLHKFVANADAEGLAVRKPGQNSVPLVPIVPGSHLSLSSAAKQFKVNLNNADDADRSKIDHLAIERWAIHAEIVEGLLWDKKEGRKKTVIRATLDHGYTDDDWDDQHQWAVAMLTAFTARFNRRLS